MACYYPIRGWKCRGGGIAFSPTSPFVYIDREVLIPCGQCVGCRLERSRQWAVRCMHEASLHDENMFITLTYDDLHLPSNMSLQKRHFQLFMKRLRKFVGKKVRFFHCGEYGDLNFRPHYHACIFGFRFPVSDLVEINTKDGVKMYSLSLLELWPYGYNVVGDVTFDSAAYVARYCIKKVNGAMAKDHYGDKVPEYVTMSRRPGIGHEWIKSFKKDTYPSDTIIVNGVPCKPPRYYDHISDVDFGQRYDIQYSGQLKRVRTMPSLEMARIKGKRIRKQRLHAADCTPDRLAVREKCAKARLQLKGREL